MKKLEGLLKPIAQATSEKAKQGNAGFDNARENIDPNIKTEVLQTKEIVLNGDRRTSWPTTDHTQLTNIGTNTHAQIDTHIAAANPHTNSLDKTGDIMSGDLEFSGTGALEIANDTYAFKSKQNNNAGLVFSLTNDSFEFRDTAANAVMSIFLTGIIRKGSVRVSTQFDKTNATLAIVTGLTRTLLAGRTYKFKAFLFIAASAIGGSKFGLAAGGGLTATNIIYQITLLDNTTSAYTITSRQTATNTSAGQAGTTAGLGIIEGLITVNAGGTLGVIFAQNAANGTSSVLVGSTYEIEEVA